MFEARLEGIPRSCLRARRLAAPMFAACAAHAAFGCTAQERACVRSHQLALTSGDVRAQYLLLEPEQEAAVGALELTLDGAPARELCSGVLVHPDWVLTAAHCTHGLDVVDVVVRFGAEAARPLTEVSGIAVHLHPREDLLLVQLSEPVAAEQGVVPMLVANSAPPGFGVTSRVQVAGFGFTQSAGFGERSFLVETVTAWQSSSLTVSSAGRGGACNGDSGGPLLVRDERGRVVVLGVLSHGAASCFGTDTYTRIDATARWFAEFFSQDSSTPPLATNAVLSNTGRCFGDIAVTAADGELVGEACDSGRVCGWSSERQGFACVAPEADACSGVSELGECQGGAVVRCASGALSVEDCTACGAHCAISPASGRAACYQSDG